MASADVDLDADSKIDRHEEYEYDDDGIRVAKTEKVDTDDDGTVDTTTRTDYHVDKQNHTGYAQVLEEMNGATGEILKSYTFGLDAIEEAVAASQVRRLLKDSHGSTRQLVDALGNVIANGSTPQIYAYDAYGIPVGFNLAAALTTLLYSGEMTDQLTGLQYLRARYYNPATGTFNRLDPFGGNFRDPQSLHKYLYTHADPVNGVDPSGMILGGLVGLVVSVYNGAKNRVSDAAAAFNTLRNVKSMTDVFEAIKAISVLTNFAHDTLNVLFTVWDVLNFDPSDIADIKQQIEKSLDFSLGIGALPISMPKVLEITLPVKMRGKLKYMFDLDPTGKAAETLGLVGAVAAAKAMGMRQVDIPVRYHGFDALMHEPISNRLMVLEAKGNDSTLAQNTDCGDQMSGTWIKKKAERLIETKMGTEWPLLQKEMTKIKLGAQGMWAAVVKTVVGSATGKVKMYLRVRTYSILSDIDTKWGAPLD